MTCTVGKGVIGILISRCGLWRQPQWIFSNKGLSRCDMEPEPSEVQQNVQDANGVELRCFSSLIDQPPAWSHDPATPIP